MAPSSTGVPTFRPTMKDCQGSWEAYICKIEPKFKKVGICKIIPPKGWKPCKGDMESKEFTLQRPIEQTLTGKQGFFQALQLVRKKMSLQEDYAPLAKDSQNQPKNEDVEREFWRSNHLQAPIYGADCEATLCDSDTKTWNISQLDSLLSRVLKDKIPGVNTSYLYFGMWRTFFGWHSEDMDLHSVNYLHYGAPKYWYCIPPDHRDRFEAWVKGLVPDCFRECSEFIRHKELLISPSRLRDANIPFTKMVQHAGEMVINYPGAYHSGFNSGFNCAESTNFATKAWIPYGADTDSCTCRKDTVKIDMRHFLDYTDKKTRQLIEERFFSDSENGSESEASASYSDLDSDEESDAEPAASVASPRHQAARKNRKAGKGETDAASKKRAAERDPGKEESKPKKRKENCSPKAQAKPEPAPTQPEESQPQVSGKREGSRKRTKTFKAKGLENRPLRKAARQDDFDDEPLLPSGASESPPMRPSKSTELSKRAGSQGAAALEGSVPFPRELIEGGGDGSTKDSGRDFSPGVSSPRHRIQEAMQA